MRAARSAARAFGSSPLARGLLVNALGGRLGCGIIPARAGFTPELTWALSPRMDHPRSRGVYVA